MASQRTIIDALNEQVPYGESKRVVTHLRLGK
jgi:hypothetical protein